LQGLPNAPLLSNAFPQALQGLPNAPLLSNAFPQALQGLPNAPLLSNAFPQALQGLPNARLITVQTMALPCGKTHRDEAVPSSLLLTSFIYNKNKFQ
jgi:hypothetical protein